MLAPRNLSYDGNVSFEMLYRKEDMSVDDLVEAACDVLGLRTDDFVETLSYKGTQATPLFFRYPQPPTICMFWKSTGELKITVYVKSK